MWPHKGDYDFNDIATGILKMKLVRTKVARLVKEAIIELLAEYKLLTHTITYDNGKGFAEHE
jgi:IS30 family transposase